jgi:GPH family glycoside/pentoside/hexuronide:cation symporter
MLQTSVVEEGKAIPGVKLDLSYGLISFGTTTLWAVLGGWLLYFYLPPDGQGSALVPATLYGASMFLLRTISALVAPSVGYLSDRTRSRWGRRLPFMFVAAGPLLLFFVLIWTPPVAGESVWNLVYLVVVMALYEIAYLLNQVPHMALLPEVATTDHHRVRMSAWTAGLMVAGMIVAAAAGPLIGRLGYLGTALVYAVVVLPAFYLPFLVLRERSDLRIAEARRLSFRQNLATMVHNRAFVVMTATGVFYWGIMSLVQAALPYVVTEICLLSEADTLLFYVPALFASLLCYPLVTSLSARWGKWRVFSLSLLASALVLPGVALIGDWIPVPLRIQGILWVTLQAVTFSGVVVLPRAFGAEIVDHDEELTGLRREGIYYATWGLLDQVINGATAALLPILLLLGRSRYAPNGPLGVRMVGVLGGVLLLIGFLVFMRYPLRDRTGERG